MRLATLVATTIAYTLAHGKGRKGKKAYLPSMPIHIPVSLPRPVVLPTSLPPPPPRFQEEYQCTEPSTTCPDGYLLQGGVCTMDLVEAPQYVCRAGRLQGTECATVMPSGLECEHGYILHGNVCTRQSSVDALPVCPHGYVEGKGGCVKEVPAPVIDYCAQGTRVGTDCVVRRTFAPQVNSYCPPDYDLEDGECCRIETYDCTPPGAELLDCGDSYGDDCIPSSSMWRGLHGKKGFMRPLPVPFIAQKPVEIPDIERTKEVSVIQQTCQKKVTTPLVRDVFCTEGQLVGNSCVIEQHYPVEQRCSVGGDPSYCFNTVTSPPNYTCADGQVISGRNCLVTHTTAPYPTCQNGWTLTGDQCMQLVPASPTCAGGRLGADGMCHDNSFRPPTTTWCVTCTGSDCRPVGCTSAL